MQDVIAVIPRANWASYAVFSNVFETARGFAGEVFDYSTFDHSVFAYIFYYYNYSYKLLF